MKKVVVFDVEADGLKATKLHCLSANMDDKIHSTTSYEKMAKLMCREDIILVGHNIVRYDIPTLERLLGTEVKCELVDTLSISWYLEPERKLHGLEAWGEEFGVPKPVITDWENLTTEEYIHRCEEDVKINTLLWKRQWKQLVKLYEGEEQAWEFIRYLTFKMKCAADQEKFGWKLDVERCTEALERLSKLKEEKVVELAQVMPKVPVIKKKTRPAKPFKMDGSKSATGVAWFKLLEGEGLPEDYDGVVEYVDGYKEPNPGSHDQIKDWLYSLGWVPSEFKYQRNKETGDIKKIPQVSLDSKHPDYPSVCPCVQRLFEKEPKLEVLNGLSVLSHRISILKGFLANVDEHGYVQAKVQGLTNTLRFKHAVVVNLPGVDKPYGEDIRGCLIAPEGFELCGSDCSSLENRTGHHYMWEHDPEYVKEQLAEDYDPHLKMAVVAGMVTEAEVLIYKRHKDNPQEETKTIYEKVAAARKLGKAVNYSATYGAGAATISRTANITEQQAAKLHAAYWKLNWSIPAAADCQKVKKCDGREWLYNPVSGFWYSLRHRKDVWSTLNQGTGVFCFDTWVKHVKAGKVPVVGQMHDEIICLVRKGKREKLTKFLHECMDKVNKELKLNRELDCSVDFGDAYSDIH